VAGREGGDDRHQGGGLGGVALETADLQRKSGAVDQQADDDLRVDAPFLGIADLTQLVFVLGLEIQGRHVVEQQAQPAPVRGMGEALGRDRIPVVPGVDPREVTLNGLVGHRLSAQIREHPRSASALLVGSTRRAITRSRNTGSSTMSKPSQS